MEKDNVSRSGYLPKCHEMLRLPRKVTLKLHQILRLPRKMNLMIDPITYETSFTMRGASKVNLQPHQILRLHFSGKSLFEMGIVDFGLCFSNLMFEIYIHTRFLDRYSLIAASHQRRGSLRWPVKPKHHARLLGYLRD